MFAECEVCKCKIEISSNGVINHKKEFKINGKSIFLTYYDCQSCGKRHYVQIDDMVSLKKLKEAERMFIKLSVARRNDKEITEKQQAKFKKARQNLSSYRMKLMKEYTGKSIHADETDSEFELRFSI